MPLRGCLELVCVVESSDSSTFYFYFYFWDRSGPPRRRGARLARGAREASRSSRRGLGRIRAGFSLSPGVMSAVNSVTFLNF